MERGLRGGRALNSRYGVAALLDRLADARVEGRLRPTVAVMSAVCASLIAVEGVSGSLLALYYEPTKEGARTSVQTIVTHVEFGALVRSIHAWGAHLLLATLLATLGVVLATGLHRKPNDVGWSLGVAAWFAAIASAFTGSILPWSDRSLVDATVSSRAVAYVPFAGKLLSGLWFGSTEHSTSVSLLRVYGLHVGGLPTLGLALAVILLLSGLGRVTHAQPPSSGTRVFPELVLWGAAGSIGTFALLLGLASLAPISLGAPPDPRGLVVATSSAPWFVAPLHALLRASPATILGVAGPRALVTCVMVAGLGALLLPWFERRLGRSAQVLGLILYVLALGVTIREALH